jgi:hypothetical protein
MKHLQATIQLKAAMPQLFFLSLFYDPKPTLTLRANRQASIGAVHF